jgi:hypothetical protein
MRKETKKLAHPNFIVSSLEKPIYSTTTISRHCNVGGPDCNDSIDENDHHKLGWATSEDFGRNGDYDFDICPDCQKTNCMKCFDEEPLLDTGQCQNQNCIDHRNCSECEEPYFNNRYGDSYCINEDCGKNENNIKHKEGSRSYWVDCDGPDCDSEGYDPEYDMGKDWHQTSSSYDGENTTDYCPDCWDEKVCKQCANPYSDEELKFPVGERICGISNCYHERICPKCEYSLVNDFGNCKNPTESPYDDCKYCRHCNQEVRPTTGSCPNKKCKAYEVPLYEQIFGE